MTQDEFIDICDKFTNKKIFKTNKDGSLFKDNTLSLKKINYDNWLLISVKKKINSFFAL